MNSEITHLLHKSDIEDIKTLITQLNDLLLDAQLSGNEFMIQYYTNLINDLQDKLNQVDV